MATALTTMINVSPAYRSPVRYALRNYACDMLPAVTEFVPLSEPNEWGHTVLATLQYRRSGALTCLGGSLTDSGQIAWTCYLD